MTTIVEKIEAAHYVANEAQVEALAHAQYTMAAGTQRANTTYLRILGAGCQAKLGAMKRGKAPSRDSQIAVLESVHERLYQAVIRGITTPDVAADPDLERDERQRRMLERNRRSTFARVAKGSWLKYVKEGGDIRAVDIENITRQGLALLAAGPEAGNKEDMQIDNAQGRLLRSLARRARGDPEAARSKALRAVAAIQGLVASWVQDEAPVVAARQPRREGRTVRTRVGEPLLRLGT